ncbi:MAG: toll/interleukin-1 receptor domain-containing protein [Bacteroidota bacterium]
MNSFQFQRIEDISKQIQKLQDQLIRWEEKYDLAENPKEEDRCKKETTHILLRIKGYTNELNLIKEGMQKEENENDVPSEKRDAFLSFSLEDKLEVANPLFELLLRKGISLWYSGFELALGDSIMESVNKGLSISRYGIVILSPNYIGKAWPLSELNAMFAKQTAHNKKVILPVWHNISYEDVLHKAPLMADKFAVSTEQGLLKVAQKIVDSIKVEH